MSPQPFGLRLAIRTGWLVDPREPAALAAAMREAIEDQDERLRRGRAARLAVCRRFSWLRISAELASVLAEVLAGAPAASAVRHA